jgi:hypothetical protein
MFPKLPKRMKQPRKDVLYDQLRLAADAIIRERAKVIAVEDALRVEVNEEEKAA